MAFSMFHVVCVLISVGVYGVEAFNESSIQKTIEYINSVQSSWKAEYNPQFAVDAKSLKYKLGALVDFTKPKKLETWSSNIFSDEFPKEFDLRKAHPACSDLISKIRDQANCGSCWAVSSAAVFSDSLCIASNGTFNQPLSSDDLMRCCASCKGYSYDGCEGGYLYDALQHFKRRGVVTGGEYDSRQGCMPYPFSPYGRSGRTRYCSRLCTNRHYNTFYHKDKHYAKKVYSLRYDPKIIKHFLMTKGSCVVGMDVYDEFLHYRSGVYKHVTGKNSGGHAVRLIGWGVENGADYWLVANSWGTSWGTRGTFKINHRSGCNFGDEILGVEV